MNKNYLFKTTIIFLFILSLNLYGIKYRRPFSVSVGVNYGFDDDGSRTNGSCKDYRCRTNAQCYDGHRGTDFPVSIGTNIVAATGGTIVATYNGCANYGSLHNTCGNYCGNYVKINHGSGYYTLYCHMKQNSIVVHNGQNVSCGQKIGQSASSGSSTGPHLHFGTLHNSSHYDPFDGSCAPGGTSWVNQGTYPHNKPSTSCGCTCTPGAKQYKACGNCGKRKRTCSSSCHWGSWGSCYNQGECAVGAKKYANCGNCGKKKSTCSSTCHWGSWGSCYSQGECAVGAKKYTDCGNCGKRKKTCSSSCSWGSWGSCYNQGECSPGSKKDSSCGNCGIQKKVCDDSCSWNNLGNCNNQGECAAGSIKTENCCDCGTRNKRCDSSCKWNNWSECAGEDPNNGNNNCETDLKGICKQGKTRCINGCLTCDGIYKPQDEICDDIDNNCDGVIDEDSPDLEGVSKPKYGATVKEFSYPKYLSTKDSGKIWAIFKNEGLDTWYAGTIWLMSKNRELSNYDWVDENIPVIIDKDVEPGEEVLLSFNANFRNSHEDDELIEEEFYLAFNDGEMRCPTPKIDLKIAYKNSLDKNEEIHYIKNRNNSSSSCNYSTYDNSEYLLLILFLFITFLFRIFNEKDDTI